ncbi:hypothetical protein TMatcc_000673 [Talaromyces marneffei ATCC 18224]
MKKKAKYGQKKNSCDTTTRYCLAVQFEGMCGVAEGDICAFERESLTSDALNIAELECLTGLFAVGASLFPYMVEASGESGNDIVAASEVEILDLVFVLIAALLRLASGWVNLLAGKFEIIRK